MLYSRDHVRRGYVVFGLSHNMAAVAGSVIYSGGGRHGEHHCAGFDAAVGHSASHARTSKRGERLIHWRQQRVWEL